MLSAATLVFAAGNVIVVASVPVNVNELLTVNVLPSAIVSVAPVAGAVIATLLMLEAVAVSILGVVKTGLVVIATLPLPLMVYSPNIPALSKSTRVVAPEPIVVAPTVKDPAAPPGGVDHVPSALKKLTVPP